MKRVGQIDYEGGATPRRVNGIPREPRAGPPTGEVPKGGQPPEKAGPPPGAEGGGVPLRIGGAPGLPSLGTGSRAYVLQQI